MLVDLKETIEILESEKVVAIPTETVYGLAGILTSDQALKLIFETKKRPFFDPLIVHVRDKQQAQTLTSEWPATADALADAFWPGPLTLVVRKNSCVPDIVTAGLERVGLRCPSHPLALQVLQALQDPFAAPSANLFGRTSPTTALHVENEFQGLIPVLDGGACDIGIESTVLLVDANHLAILRKGHVRSEEIEQVLKKKNLEFHWLQNVSKSESPGHMKHHYMPSKPLFWVNGSYENSELIKKLNQVRTSLPQEVEGVKLVIPGHISSIAQLRLPKDPLQSARQLYAELRKLGEGPEDCLVFFPQDYHEDPSWDAVLERLKKAASAII